MLPRKGTQLPFLWNWLFHFCQADPFFGTWVPVGTIFAITAPVYLFLKKKRFYSSRSYFRISDKLSENKSCCKCLYSTATRHLWFSTILHGCFPQEIHRLRNWTGHCLSPDGERLLGPAIPLINLCFKTLTLTSNFQAGCCMDLQDVKVHIWWCCFYKIILNFARIKVLAGWSHAFLFWRASPDKR